MRKLFRVLQGAESTPLPAKTPDITNAQIGGWLQFVASVGVALTLLNQNEADVLIGASGLIAVGLHVSDAIIRKGRAGAIAAVAISQTIDAQGGGQMGVTAPHDGAELPPSPTLDGAPEVDVSLDGTGTTPPPEEVADDSPPVAPEPPTPAPKLEKSVLDLQIEDAQKRVDAAQRTVEEAGATLAELRARQTAPTA